MKLRASPTLFVGVGLREIRCTLSVNDNGSRWRHEEVRRLSAELDVVIGFVPTVDSLYDGIEKVQFRDLEPSSAVRIGHKIGSEAITACLSSVLSSAQRQSRGKRLPILPIGAPLQRDRTVDGGLEGNARPALLAAVEISHVLRCIYDIDDSHIICSRSGLASRRSVGGLMKSSDDHIRRISVHYPQICCERDPVVRRLDVLRH